nr:Chain A, Hypothetical protein PA2703 Pseudomonas aeruginosa PAO1 [Pseudomonas aeruginosa]3STQ_B Chain B, Hypothetical protein PA2703 Pseudomonas aeruginosa PAO1 [Pseudomonas aeruginosa]3STQ_C Chain C, Hypothetical protein PA2703 Pseudomonas aeruginosa PAO1 [Pseudomonas aeruginosa]3STQ_D Chain D, Hypothetical protein PA2703 Pseudomonas aeruginosa PAO1 [Pseudomonas aeruginosa]3STQ_E Chain E, Hypothetical protein PA2703 Pseudomonas aeruginosa PAO1 [Pseudomonas aeruginosa]3STQ_F Chain F, Hypoth
MGSSHHHHHHSQDPLEVLFQGPEASMNLKPQTLMVAIQCVAARTRELDAQLQNDDPQNAAELEQLLVGYDLAADDLKNAYEQALGQYSGLPPYDRLIEEPAS